MTSTPNKRKNISLEEKYEIIKDKQKGMSVKDLSEKYNYGAYTFRPNLQQYVPLQRQKTRRKC